MDRHLKIPILIAAVGFALEAVAFAISSLPLFLLALSLLAAPLVGSIAIGLRARRLR